MGPHVVQVFDDDRLNGIEHVQSTYSDLGATQPADAFLAAKEQMKNAMSISCTATTGSQVFDDRRQQGIEREAPTSSDIGSYYRTEKRIVATQPSASGM
jgi:hypothetical protein